MENLKIKNIKKETLKIRKKRDTKIIAASMDVFVFPVGGIFERAIFEEILAEKDCTHIKFYYGLDKKGKMQFEFVGVDSEEEDIVPES